MARHYSVFGGRAEGARKERMAASKQFVDGAFANTSPLKGPGLKGNPLPLMGEYFFNKTAVTPPGPLPVHDPRASWQTANETGLRVTWLGHSTTLLELDGFRVLTDPVWGQRASPLGFAGPKRFHEVPVRIADLPRLDAVLISHDHYDHLCFHTLRELAALEVPFVTSLGVGAHLESWGIAPARIIELDWWQSHTFAGGSLSFTATPAQHFSGRGMGDRNHTLWSSWVMQTDAHRVFFSGDTGLTDEFAQIGAKFGPFDVAMFEVGAFHEAWSDIHLGPENALKAHALLGSGLFFPVHWGTFNLALHAWDQPAELLVSLAEQQRVRLVTPELGAPFEPSRVEGVNPWWRQVR